MSNSISYLSYGEDKTEKRPCAAEHGEARHKTCSVKDSLGPRIVSTKQRLGSRQHINDSHSQNRSHTKLSSVPEQEA